MKDCLLANQILIEYTENLVETQLNGNIKKLVFEELRKTPNIESIDSVLQAIKAFVSDENSSKNMKNGKKNSVFHTREERGKEENLEKQGRQCFLCDKRHKFRPT